MLGKLAAIRQSFLQRTRSGLPVLLELLDRLQAGDATGLLQLHSYVHRIRGGGATFEFAAISKRAGEIEDLLDLVIGISTVPVVEAHAQRRLLKYGRRLALEIGAAKT
jgi:HPt (histidine-containing phosphotransfer) domain-containing protein